jgi:MFS family permease
MESHGRLPTARAEWKAGWTIPVSGMIGLYLGVTFLYSVGTFMGPLERALGWSRQEISAGVSILGLLGAAMHAIAGLLADRFGARRVGLVAIVLYSLSLMVLSQVSGSVWQWWAGAALIGITYGLMSSVVWTTGVISQFDRSRGAAVAIVQLGPAIALTTLPLLATWLIVELGWRGAYLAIACAGLLLVFPIVFLGFHDRRFAETERQRAQASERVSAPQTDKAFWSSREFWTLAVAILFAVSGLSGTSIHFMPMLTDRGLDRVAAAGVASFIGLGSLTGRLLCGAALDRFSSSVIGAIAFALPAAAATILLLAGTSPLYLAAAGFLMGVSLGAEIDVAAYVTSRLFGLVRYGRIFGLLVACMSIATGIGPWVAGKIHDVTGAYVGFQFYVIGCSIVATLLMSSLGSVQRSGVNVEPQAA